MSDTSSQSKKPTHRVIAALDRGKGKDPFYQKIGAGWETDKGTIWLSVELWPTDPKASIGIRPIVESEEDSQQQ